MHCKSTSAARPSLPVPYGCSQTCQRHQSDLERYTPVRITSVCMCFQPALSSHLYEYVRPCSRIDGSTSYWFFVSQVSMDRVTTQQAFLSFFEKRSGPLFYILQKDHGFRDIPVLKNYKNTLAPKRSLLSLVGCSLRVPGNKVATFSVPGSVQEKRIAPGELRLSRVAIT